MAWLDPFTIGTNSMVRNAAGSHTANDRPAPSGTVPSKPDPIMPNSTPWMRRLGPPHRLSASPPTTPPAPMADCMLANASSSFPVRASTIGALTTMPSVAVRLMPR